MSLSLRSLKKIRVPQLEPKHCYDDHRLDERRGNYGTTCIQRRLPKRCDDNYTEEPTQLRRCCRTGTECGRMVTIIHHPGGLSCTGPGTFRASALDPDHDRRRKSSCRQS